MGLQLQIYQQVSDEAAILVSDYTWHDTFPDSNILKQDSKICWNSRNIISFGLNLQSDCPRVMSGYSGSRDSKQPRPRTGIAYEAEDVDGLSYADLNTEMSFKF